MKGYYGDIIYLIKGRLETQAKSTYQSNIYIRSRLQRWTETANYSKHDTYLRNRRRIAERVATRSNIVSEHLLWRQEGFSSFVTAIRRILHRFAISLLFLLLLSFSFFLKSGFYFYHGFYYSHVWLIFLFNLEDLWTCLDFRDYSH